MIPGDHEHFSNDGRRTSFAEAVSNPHVAEVSIPNRFTVHRKCKDTLRAKARIDQFTIGARRGGGETVCLVGSFVGLGDDCGLFPAEFPAGPIDTEEFEIKLVALAGRYCRSDEDIFSPDDWGPGTATGYLELPSQVLRGSKLDGWLSGDRQSIPNRSTPMPPILGGDLGLDFVPFCFLTMRDLGWE